MMAEGKPYRWGLVAAGLCVAALGLFIMAEERAHVYGTLCALGVLMVCMGTAWSMCQCYPKVTLVSREGKGLEDILSASTEAKHPSNGDTDGDVGDDGDGLPHGCHGETGSSCLVPEMRRHHHSCPALNLI
ncbi:hypothetical protein CRUP_026216 [Coryphaenoides rupestris]|nr:hypothetical protein CRUP_026216 [Coryphaenoides rupestris]